MIRCSLIQFFRVVSPPPGWMLIALLLVTVSGCATLWFNPGDVDSALGPILLLQMFSASSGFTHAAARGHFDPVLVGSRGRLRASLASFAAAAAPALCGWAAVTAWAVLLGQATRVLSGNRIVAMLVVSSVAWGAGVAMPRLSAGAAWSMVLVGLALSRGSLMNALLVVQRAPESLSQVLGASGACLLCPFLLLGEFAAAKSVLVLGLDVAAAAVVASGAVAYLCRRDYALVDPA